MKYFGLKAKSHLFKEPSLVGNLAKWLVLLTEFDVEYLTKKIVKGRAVVKFLALNPTSNDQEIEFEFPNDLAATI